MRPILVAAVPALRRRRGTGGVAFEPRAHVVVIKLLVPEHPRQGLPHDSLGIDRQVLRDARGVKFFGFFLALREEAVESRAEVVGAGNAFGTFGVRGRSDGANLGRFSVHSAERLNLRQPQFQSRGLAGIKM